MRRGRTAREVLPRAHWVVLVAVLLTMAAALLLYGYVRHDVGGSTTGHPAAGSDSVPESLREGGPVVDLQHGPLRARKPSPRTVALTFDDGPDPQWTPQVLQVLARRHVPATFFVLGAHVLQYPDLVRQEVAAGHEIGAHTFTHADLGGVPAWRQRLELSQTEVALAGTTGLATSLLRPPYASNSDSLDDKDWAVVRRSAALGYVTVFADRDGEDWARPGVDQIVNNAMPQGDDGAIVLLHDAGGDRAQTVAALDELIDRLQQRGYRFTTASAAVGLSSGNAAATPAQRWRGEAVLWAYRASVAVSVALQVLLSAVGVLMLGRVLLLVAIARRHARRRRNGWAATSSEPVSVVVPAYQECEHIQATVRALAASDHPEFEILVVDDGSTDGTADLVEELNLPGVRVIRKPNGGKPSALNTGIAHARHDLLVFVDADTVFQPDTIRRLVAPFADPGIGAVSGNAKVGNRRGLLGRWQHIEYVVGFNLDRRTYDVLGCMPTVPGAVGAFRRAAMDEVGGVSDDTLAEDTDVTLALVGAGWRVVYEERAVAWTEAPASLGQLWKQRYRWCYGTVQAMWKHRGTILRRGPAGRLGRRGLVFLGLFQVLLPLIAPVMDGYLLYGLVFLDPLRTALVWSGLFLLQVLSAVYAFRLDAERLRPLWTLPLQQIFYRQLMYLVVIQSVVTAVSGVRMGWHKLRRTNTVEVPDLPAGR